MNIEFVDTKTIKSSTYNPGTDLKPDERSKE